MILKLLFIIVLVLMVAFLVTQVVLPLLFNNPVFPLFRNSTEKSALEKVEKTLEEANEVADIKNRVEALAKKVSSKIENGKVK